MLQLLTARECGLDPPWLFPRSYGSRRFSQLELSKEKELGRFHSAAVNSLDLDCDGRYLISGGGDVPGSIAIHDTSRPAGEKGLYVCAVTVSTYGTQCHTDVSHAVSVVQWFPHDTGIFTTSSGDRYLKVWDTNELLVVEKFKFKKPIYSHAMSAGTSHSLTAVGGGECKLTLCDLVSGASSHVLEGHLKPVMAVAWSTGCEHVLASGSQDNRVILWDIRKANGPLMTLDQHNGARASNDPSVTVAHGGSVNGVRFSPDSLHLVSFGTDDRLRLWDTATGKNTLVNYGRVYNTLPKQNCPLAFSPLSSTLHPLVCVPVGGEVIMFDLMTGNKVNSLSGHFGTVHSLVVHPVEQELYSGGSDANILCWMPPPPMRLSAGRARRSAATGAVYQDAWSSDEDDDDQTD